MRSNRAPRRSRLRLRELVSFGGRIDVVVGALILAVASASLFGAIAARFGFPVEKILLVPGEVFGLELWRLFTWSFVEGSPLALVFSLIFLYFIGGDLAVSWGSRRFLRVYAGLSTAVAALTCLVALLDPDVLGSAYYGTLALASGLVVAWGLLHPDRQILLYLVLPVTGRAIVVLTLVVTVVYGIYYGFATIVPELLAEGLMAAYVRGPRLLRRRKKRAKPTPAAKKRVPRVQIERGGHIRLVEEDDE